MFLGYEEAQNATNKICIYMSLLTGKQKEETNTSVQNEVFSCRHTERWQWAADAAAGVSASGPDLIHR